MSEFAAKLSASLQGASTGFKKADDDLNQEILAASQDIARISNGSVQLKLSLKDEDSKGVYYSLRLVNGERKVPVSIVFVPWEGYPMTIDDCELNSRAEINEHLNELASSPVSSLVQGMAYLMRPNNEVA